MTLRVESTLGSPRAGAGPQGDPVPNALDDDVLDTGALIVCCHSLLNDLGVIGSAARTLNERRDELSPAVWETLVHTISDAVDRGAERLRLMVLTPAMAVEPVHHGK